jgi:signal transduction histidine kinase/CheY-like chemotaxis protein
MKAPMNNLYIQPKESSKQLNGDLRQVLQKELSILFVCALGAILIWSGVNHYYGSFLGGMTWLESSQKSFKNKKTYDKLAFADRLHVLAKAMDLEYLLKENESFLKLKTQGSETQIMNQKGDISKSLFNKIQHFVTTHNKKSSLIKPTSARYNTRVYFMSESNEIYLIALLIEEIHHYVLIKRLDEIWLNRAAQVAGTEAVLVTSNSEILHSTFKSKQGNNILPYWTKNDKDFKIFTEAEKTTGYHKLKLPNAYFGTYGEYHVNETEFNVFHISIPLNNINQETIAWFLIILPEDVMLFWPKISILGLIFIGLLTLITILWRIRVKTFYYLTPINELTVEIEKLNLAIGGLSTLKERSRFHDINHLKQAVMQLKHQINLNKDLENQLRQSQKMEVVGTLAGGVAHDFNNLLSVILLNSEFLQSDLQSFSDDSKENHSQSIEWQNMTKEMILACEQAKVLTQQLLSLSRDQSNQHEFFDICQSIKKSHTLLQRLVPEDIVMHLHLELNELWTKGNENALQQVIMNLVLNAKDAISYNGHIYIELSTHTQRRVEALYGGALKPGEYACIKIQDTGHGISDEHMNQIFEPFFSLKGNKGTGLGLTVVYNTIVRRFKGGIHIESTPKQGSIFYLYIPTVTNRSIIESENLHELKTPIYGQHLILLEDHNLVRHSMTQILINLGFKITAFASGIEFIQWIGAAEQQEIDGISLVVTDVVMPNLSGPAVWLKLKDEYPELPFLFLTGYDNDILNQYQVPQDLILFKPASIDILYKKIVEIIGITNKI